MSDPQREIALVTGASRGIGRAIAMALAAGGRHVVMNYHSRVEAAEATLREIEAVGGSAELLPFDVADVDAVNQAIEGVLARHGRVDVLINNAGRRNDMLMVWMQPQDWRQVLDTNLSGFYHVTRPIIKDMLLRRSGRVVNIVSTSGQSGMAGQTNYSASKAGLIGATQALAREVARRGITVNAVAPGYIDTEMIADLDREQLLKTIPAARLGRPEEVAATVMFLCSPMAGYITGQVIGVNGGVF